MLLATSAGGGTRMSELQLTRADLLTAMAQEPISSSDKCALFASTFRDDGAAWTNAAAREFNDGACASRPAATATAPRATL